jgi:hypothetical protein
MRLHNVPNEVSIEPHFDQGIEVGAKLELTFSAFSRQPNRALESAHATVVDLDQLKSYEVSGRPVWAMGEPKPKVNPRHVLIRIDIRGQADIKTNVIDPASQFPQGRRIGRSSAEGINVRMNQGRD